MDGFISMLPNYGDVVLHCGHISGAPGVENFHVMREPGMKFTRSDGTTGTANWAMVCNLCFDKWGKDAMRAINGDTVWRGEE